MPGRMYVRCPRCQAEEPVKVHVDVGPQGERPADAQRCTVCEADVVIAEATTYRRP